MPDKYEQFMCEYLRLNGYFIVPNFIVHDSRRVYADKVGNLTETDVLAIRMPYSIEQTDHLQIANDPQLVDGQNMRFDVVIGEAKSGDGNKPNSIWRKKDNPTKRNLNEKLKGIKYVIQFIGLFSDDGMADKAAQEMLDNYHIELEGDDTLKFPCRIRLIIFASEPNKHYQELGVKYITFEQVARFLVLVRGRSWIEMGRGVASSHPQWNPFLNKIFEIANDYGLSDDERQTKILAFLSEKEKLKNNSSVAKKFELLTNNDVFNQVVEKQYRKLANKFITQEHIVDRVKKIYQKSESCWHQVIEDLFLGSEQKIKYILIAEAPPWHPTGIVSYFYNPDTPKKSAQLLSTIYGAFSGMTVKESNTIDNWRKIEELCQVGFLLIDMMPIGLSYSKIGRPKKLYSGLVNMGMDYFIDKLKIIEPLLDNDFKIRITYKLQVDSLKAHFPDNHFASHQINHCPAINTSTFGVPFIKDIVNGFELD